MSCMPRMSSHGCIARTRSVKNTLKHFPDSYIHTSRPRAPSRRPLVSLRKTTKLTVTLTNMLIISPFHHFNISSFHHFIIATFHPFIISSFHHVIISSFHYFIIRAPEFDLPVSIRRSNGFLELSNRQMVFSHSTF